MLHHLAFDGRQHFPEPRQDRLRGIRGRRLVKTNGFLRGTYPQQAVGLGGGVVPRPGERAVEARLRGFESKDLSFERGHADVNA